MYHFVPMVPPTASLLMVTDHSESERLCYSHGSWPFHLPTPSHCDSGSHSQFAVVCGSAHLLSLPFNLLPNLLI